MTKKNISKKIKDKEIIKPLTKKEVLNKFENANHFSEHPDAIYKNVGKLFSEVSPGNFSDEEGNAILKGLYLNTFEKSHIYVSEGLDGDIKIGAIELINNLIEEYDCNTTLEKTLCETIALNYGKLMQFSKKFNSVMIAGEYLSDDRTRYLSMLGKELDRVNRSYLTSLNNLIELKRPQMNIKVNTKNAYFGQNQQFNNNKIKDENIKD